MKSRVLSSLGVLMVVATLLSMTGCMKNTSKNAILKMTASSVKKGTLKSANVSGPIQLASGSLNLTTASINIVNLKIEENSGNDVEQQGGNQDVGGVENDKAAEGTEASGSEKKNEKNESGSEDIYLPGPFSPDISGGEAVIDQVSVYPGTFKKVNFTFQVTNDTPFNGHSIIITGNYVATDGTSTPFALSSDFAKQIQLPLANGGITVQANATTTVSIVFDLTQWLGGLDFNGAIITDGTILIDSSHNTALLTQFENQVSANIDVENE